MKNELELDVVFMITRAPTRRAREPRPCRDGVVPTQGYGLAEWRESLKEILLYAGIKNQPAVFLFSDTQIVFEAGSPVSAKSRADATRRPRRPCSRTSTTSSILEMYLISMLRRTTRP